VGAGGRRGGVGSVRCVMRVDVLYLLLSELSSSQEAEEGVGSGGEGDCRGQSQKCDEGTLYQEQAVFGKMKMDPAKRAQTQNAGEVLVCRMLRIKNTFQKKNFWRS
jgi:hypothetical protein